MSWFRSLDSTGRLMQKEAVRFLSRGRLVGTYGFVLCAAACCATSRAQMSIGSLSGVLPATTPTSSLILGDNLTSLQTAWQGGGTADQQVWVTNIASRANANTSGAVPADFGTARTDSSIAQAAGLRYAMTGNVADLNKAVAALEVLDVPGGTFITRPEVLTSYLSAYDFIRGASTADLPAATRQTIESRLLTETQSLGNGNNTFSNARAKHGATRAMAGVLLRDQALLDQGLSDLQGHFDYSTTDDGWFTDSQGHYLNYTLRHVALFARVYQQGSGVDLSSNLKPYIDMTIGLRKPDGTAPNVSNGLNSAVGLHYLMSTADPETAANTRWYIESTTPSPYGWLNTNLANNDNTYASAFALADVNSVTAAAPTSSPTFFAPGQSKVTVFRNDWGPTSDYLLISPGIDSPSFEFQSDDPPIDLSIPAFHTQNDTGEILLSARGKYILVAPGYERGDLSNSPSGLTTKWANWHNVVLVDGAVGADNEGRKMRPEDFVQTNRLDSTELGNFTGVSDFATLEMNYADTLVRRSTAFPNEDYFVVADRMQSDTQRAYGFNLVGRGTQTVLTSEQNYVAVRWEYDGAQVIEHLIGSADLTLTTGSLWMHDTFNNFEVTQRMTATMTAQDGLFISVLETADAGTASQLSITRLFASDQQLAAQVANATENWVDTILVQQDGGQLFAAGSVESDAEYAYVRQVDGQLESLMLAEGTQLALSGQTIFETSAAVTMSLLFAETEIRGTLSADDFLVGTELFLYDQQPIAAAWLNGVPLAFQNLSNHSVLVLPSSGSLLITFVPEPATVVLIATGLPLLWWVSKRRRSKRC